MLDASPNLVFLVVRGPLFFRVIAAGMLINSTAHAARLELRFDRG